MGIFYKLVLNYYIIKGYCYELRKPSKHSGSVILFKLRKTIVRAMQDHVSRRTICNVC